MAKLRFLPILMRDDNHEVVKVGNAQYNEQTGDITFRLAIDTLMGNHVMIGRAIDMDLVESFQMKPIVTKLGFEMTTEPKDTTLEESVDSDG